MMRIAFEANFIYKHQIIVFIDINQICLQCKSKLFLKQNYDYFPGNKKLNENGMKS